jgi:hypothetical protein
MTEFTIYPIDKSQGRMYCGPTVLALLTGKSRATIHADVNRLRRKAGKKRRKTIRYRDGSYKTTKLVPWPLTAPVRGLSHSRLDALLKKYGLPAAFHPNNRYPSLRRLVEDMGHFKMPIVITVTGHYVLYYDGKVYDTYRPEGLPVDEHTYGRCRVKNYWLVRRQRKAAV